MKNLEQNPTANFDEAMKKVANHFNGEFFKYEVIPHYSDPGMSIILARNVGRKDPFWNDDEGVIMVSCGFMNDA